MPTALERLWAKSVETDDGCWEWRGSTTRGGYAQFRFNGPLVYIHRWSHEFHIGPVPEGYDVDHLCRNKACWNPAHLEAVTRLENQRRAAALRTHCKYGHPFDDQNTIWLTPSGRDCRACHRIQSRRYRLAKSLGA